MRPEVDLHQILNADRTTQGGILRQMGNKQFRQLLSSTLGAIQQRQKEWQLLDYDPDRVNPKHWEVHEADSRVTAIGGGNGSGKTETCLVELCMRATGVIPKAFRNREGFDWRKKLRGPINARIVCESLTTVLHPVILPKLQWWRWTGVDTPGGERGHWGWIPREHLIGGDWNKSWSEKLRTLRVRYVDPEDPRIQGESTIQCMSKDQDPTDFASGDFHFVLHDEPPTLPIWQENEARTMRVRGDLFLAFTWPDDPAIPVDWIHDRIYEPCLRGDPGMRWINLWTTENQMLDQEAVSAQAAAWTEDLRKVRLRGEPIRFSNRVHPLFSDREGWWCFACGKDSYVEDRARPECHACQSKEVVSYCHVVEDPPHPTWPVIHLLDPHPRKPHIMIWVQVDPQDDLCVVAETEVDGDPEKVRDRVREVESDLMLKTAKRIIDRNMALSPASARFRDRNWRDEFDAVGLHFDLSDVSDIGRSRVNTYLQPDPRTWRPRLHFRDACTLSIFQMKRFCWDEHKRQTERDLKQRPRERYDDVPALLRYCLNDEPSFAFLEGPARGLYRRRAS